jgi:membrane dipeptidase
MDRREFLLTGLALSLVRPEGAVAEGTSAPGGMNVGDMHGHLFFFGPNTPAKRPLARSMAAGNATLVAWSLVGDLPWLQRSPRGLKQKGEPGPGAALDWFEQEVARAKEHIAQQNLKLALTAEDIDKAVAGEPHVILAVEGATFIESNPPAVLKTVYDLGIRHVQLVHYIKNPLADFQTEPPAHKGLTELGQATIEECNRLGMLVDLAHATSDAVNKALAVSKAPVVWSHSSVTRKGQPNWKMPVWQARQLTLADAKAIAQAGGVVGLWPMRSDIGGGVDAYAARLAEMAEWLGEDHVGIGTDMNAIVNPSIGSYADVQGVVRLLQRRGMSDATISKMVIGNYARVLKAAFAARQA